MHENTRYVTQWAELAAVGV